LTDSSLIFTIAVSMALAFVFGFIAFKLRLSPIVGYLIAGICIGPYTPGVVANSALASQLSELGVILLMFGVGLHFSPKDLIAVSRVALLGALPQVVLSTLAASLLASLWGWSWGACFVFGLALSVASTIVVIGELEKRDLLTQAEGKAAVAWLLAQDLAVVLILVLLPALAPVLSAPTFDWHTLGTVLPSFGIACAKAAAFIAMMLFIGRRFFPWMLNAVAKTHSRELFTLFVIGIPIGISLLAAMLFGVSLALGAFLAGIVLNESELSHHAAAKALPLQDAFAVLFFVSTGMAFRPTILLTHAPQVLASVAFIIIFTPLISFLLLSVVMRYQMRVAAVVAASLAQIGEFSLVLAGLGHGLKLLPDYAHGTILGAALVSISLHSFTFDKLQVAGLSARVSGWLSKINANDPLAIPQTTSDQLKEHVILVGYGRVGTVVGLALAQHAIPYVVIEDNREIVEDLRKKSIPSIYGSADIPEVLRQAGIEHCRLLAITSPDPLTTRIICDHAHTLNNNLTVVVRTHSEGEMQYLHDTKRAELAVFGEIELGKSIAEYVTTNFKGSV
jgi:CPA2 family monovalent cation:H+ antiporter-2